MSHAGNASVRDHYGDLVKTDDSMSSPGSVMTTSPGEIESALPEEQKLVKRKGGRKPIYATTEERKQRNREAQAAFRERRNEYIKKLQKELDEQKVELALSQQNHRTAADECLVLRYKCSLLEKVLAERGMDPDIEMRTIADNSAPFMGSVGPPPPGQRQGYRTILSRPTEAQRAAAGLLPDRQDNSNLEPEVAQKSFTQASPATAMSQTSSPSSSPVHMQHSSIREIDDRSHPFARTMHQLATAHRYANAADVMRQHAYGGSGVEITQNTSSVNDARPGRRRGSSGKSSNYGKEALLPHLPLDRINRRSTEEREEAYLSGDLRLSESSSPHRSTISAKKQVTNPHIETVVINEQSSPQEPPLKINRQQQITYQQVPTSVDGLSQPFAASMISGQINAVEHYSTVTQAPHSVRLPTESHSFTGASSDFGNQSDIYFPLNTSIHSDPYSLGSNMELAPQYRQHYHQQRR